jgi:hypothetical protein
MAKATKALDGRTAYLLDSGKGTFYAEAVDEDGGDYGVFGSETGFCYSTWSSKDAAEEDAACQGGEKR